MRQPALPAWLGAIAAIASATACSTEAESFRLRLAWAQAGSPQACPHAEGAPAACATIPVSCAVRALVRITNDTGTETLYSSCHTLTGLSNACGLADLPLETSEPLVHGMARVQVAVWSEDQLTPHERTAPNANDGELDPGACPTDTAFELGGLPNLSVRGQDAWKVPALGGEIYFPIGDRRVAEVELGCPRADLLDTPACRVSAPLVNATIRDPQSWASVEDLASSLTVRFGAPTFDADLGWTLNLVDSPPLVRSTGGELLWSTRFDRAVPPIGCLQVQVFGAGTTPVAICQDIKVEGGAISVLGFAARKALVDKLRTALGLTEFPATGLVLGLVVDDRNARVAGARVLSPVAVAYPTDDFQQVGLDRTSSTGMFLSTEAPYDTVWRVEVPGGIGDDGTARGGLIAEHLSVVVVRMNAPIGGAR